MHILNRAWFTGVLVASLLRATLTSASSHEDVQVAMDLQPDLKHGAQLFAGCAACHHPADSEPADRRIPRIAGQHASVLVKQLVEFRRADRWNEHMQRVTSAHDFNLQAIADVAAFVSRLEWAIQPSSGQSDLREPGATLYRRKCGACHGVDGEGSTKRAIPRLAGQRYDYLLEQIYNVEHGRRRNIPSHHVEALAKLDLAELRDISDYLSRVDRPHPQAVPRP